MAEQIRMDPEFEKLIPPMTPAERAGLEENLISDGCREPLVVWFERPTCPCGAVPLRNGPASMFRCAKCGKDFVVAPVVLDGHNRLRICTEHSISYETVEAEDVDDRDGAKAWIIRNQIGRRNLTESQRAMLATALEGIFAKQAGQRQAEGRKAGGHARQGDSSFKANLPESRQARDDAAAEMNVSPRLVQAAKKVTQSGSPALQEAVRKGDVSVSAAADLARLPQDQQDKAVAEGPKAAVRAARAARQAGRRPSSPGGVSPHAMRPVRGHSQPELKTALELPHDPNNAARTLLSVFGRQFAVDLVVQLNLLLKGA